MTPTAPTQSETTAEPASHSQFALLNERRFAPFFWTQFLGAMNDNVFKVSLTGLITYQAWSAGGLSPQVSYRC
jgi:hypothetical protein